MLEVKIQITPPPTNPAELDVELEEELKKFKVFYAKKMQEAGYVLGALHPMEQTVVKAYLVYAMDVRDA